MFIDERKAYHDLAANIHEVNHESFPALWPDITTRVRNEEFLRGQAELIIIIFLTGL
jgi:hypothetical protein